MAQVGSLAVKTLGGLLRGDAGLGFAVGQLAAQEGVELGGISGAQIVERNVAAELVERKTGAAYPGFYVYCNRLSNTLREKFQIFSGRAQMVVEIRATHDHLDDLDRQVRLYVEAVTQVLDLNRGEWGRGMFFGGAYEVSVGPIRQGGRNFLQTATVEFALEISQ